MAVPQLAFLFGCCCVWLCHHRVTGADSSMALLTAGAREAACLRCCWFSWEDITLASQELRATLQEKRKSDGFLGNKKLNFFFLFIKAETKRGKKSSSKSSTSRLETPVSSPSSTYRRQNEANCESSGLF